MSANSSVDAGSDHDLPTTGQGQLTLIPLLALTVGSMVAGGIFNLPSNIAVSAAPGPVLIGWSITAVGMYCLAYVFRYLAEKRPDLDAGVYAYAKELLGPLPGFFSAWGYWVSAWLGNLAYFVLLFGTLGALVPAFGNGVTWPSIFAASIVLWILHFLILRGVKTAAVVNTIATVAKMVPIVVFIVLAIIGFKFDLFVSDFWGTKDDIGSTVTQISNMMLVTVWVFIGIEGASVYSGRAKDRRDVGRATIGGFFIVLALLVLVNMLSYGAMQRAEIAGLANPSLAGMMAHYIGTPGTVLVSAGLVVSLLGALLAWQLLCAEIMQVAGADGTMPAALGRLNNHDSPANAMWATSICMQVALLGTGLLGGEAYLKLILIATSMILIPYLFSAMFGSSVAFRDSGAKHTANLVPAVVATVYSVWLLYAAGPAYLLLSTLLYAPGLIVHIINRRQLNEKLFTKGEAILALIIVVMAVFAVVALTQQWVSI